MSEPPSDLSDIRQTGDDAERLLRSLDQTDRGEHAQISSVQSGDIPSNPTDGNDASQADREDRSAHPLLIVLIVAIILAPVIALLWSGSRPSGVAREAALRWQPSCAVLTTARPVLLGMHRWQHQRQLQCLAARGAEIVMPVTRRFQSRSCCCCA